MTGAVRRATVEPRSAAILRHHKENLTYRPEMHSLFQVKKAARPRPELPYAGRPDNLCAPLPACAASLSPANFRLSPYQVMVINHSEKGYVSHCLAGGY